jgi:hypothetical protein
MSRENLVRELNEVLQRDYGMEHTIEDPISVCDLALIVLALSRGKEGQQNDRAPAGDEPGPSLEHCVCCSNLLWRVQLTELRLGIEIRSANLAFNAQPSLRGFPAGRGPHPPLPCPCSIRALPYRLLHPQCPTACSFAAAAE